MPQNTNLNVTPYYDDFDKDKNFYKVLFRPGFPIQARELTSMQSILQNQVENMGTNLFKDGAMIILVKWVMTLKLIVFNFRQVFWVLMLSLIGINLQVNLLQV